MTGLIDKQTYLFEAVPLSAGRGTGAWYYSDYTDNLFEHLYIYIY